MKKYITLAAALTISLQAVKKHQVITAGHGTARAVVNYYLHDAVKLILKKITNLDIMVITDI
jgi:hypothetical protein